MNTNSQSPVDKFNIIATEPEKIVSISRRKNAYIITMFGGDAYVIGALACAKPLFEYRERTYDIIIQITFDVLYNDKLSKYNEQNIDYQDTTIYKLLKSYADYVVPIQYLLGGNPIHSKIFREKPHYTKVWTKLISLKYENYEKVCLIDADYYPNPTYIEKFNNIFDLEAPAAFIETPTLFSPNNEWISVEYNDIYPHTADLNFETKKEKKQTDKINNYLLNPLIIITQLYAQNKLYKTEGSMMFGGFNASLMLLKPSIEEFEAIKNDISDNYYSSKYRLFYFYPEQQYLTARYALPYNITIDNIDNYVNHYVNKYLPSLTSIVKDSKSQYQIKDIIINMLKLIRLRNIDISNLSKKYNNNTLRARNPNNLSRKYNKAFSNKNNNRIKWNNILGELNRLNNNNKSKSKKVNNVKNTVKSRYFSFSKEIKDLMLTISTKINQLSKTSDDDIIKGFLYSVILYYLYTERNKSVIRNNSILNSWSTIDTRYFICEYYNYYFDNNGDIKKVNEIQHYGYPLLQQNKLWTEKGIMTDNKYNPQSTGYELWYAAMENIITKLYTKFNNNYSNDKISEYSKILEIVIQNEPDLEKKITTLSRRVSAQQRT